MAELDRAHELIEKYLDGVIDQAELAELELTLVSEPAAAKEFARATRTDGFLYAHFNQLRAEDALRFAAESSRPADAAGRAEAPLPPPRIERPPILDRLPRLRARQRLKAVMEHLIGPAGSVVLHVVVIALLILLIARPPRTPTYQPPVEITYLRANDTPPLEPPPELPKEPPRPSEGQGFVPFEKGPDVVEPPSVEPPTVGPPPEDLGNAVDVPLGNQSPFKIPLNYGSRADGEREKAADEYGGEAGRRTLPAVNKALRWLKEHQSADGSWEPNDVAITGLGLLTFLAHGETTASKEYGPTVEKAIRFLLAQQDKTGAFVNTASQSGPYEHGIAAYAMAEAYGVTRIEALRTSMERAVQIILDGQQDGGGWDYKYSRGARRDTSVGGWQIQALKAAYIAGAQNEGLKDALARAAMDLKKARDPATGKFYYTDKTGHTSHGITGIAVLCLQLLGEAESKEAQDGLRLVRLVDCKWQSPPAWALYSWYYLTQAKFHAGGSDWKHWNSRFAKALVQAQNRDGSWTAPAEDEQKYGPAYSTTLAALTLQVYYRKLPTYKENAVAPATTAPEEGDVKVGVL